MGTAPPDDTFPSHHLDPSTDACPTSGDSTDGLAHLNGGGGVHIINNPRATTRSRLFVFLLQIRWGWRREREQVQIFHCELVFVSEVVSAEWGEWEWREWGCGVIETEAGWEPGDFHCYSHNGCNCFCDRNSRCYHNCHFSEITTSSRNNEERGLFTFRDLLSSPTPVDIKSSHSKSTVDNQLAASTRAHPANSEGPQPPQLLLRSQTAPPTLTTFLKYIRVLVRLAAFQ